MSYDGEHLERLWLECRCCDCTQSGCCVAVQITRSVLGTVEETRYTCVTCAATVTARIDYAAPTPAAP